MISQLQPICHDANDMCPGIHRGIDQRNDLVRRAIDSLDSHTVIVAADGRILTANQRWLDFAAANGGHINVGVGANYLTVCDRVAPTCHEAGLVARAIRQALAGDDDPESVEYACHSPTEQRWFNCTVRGFHDGDHRYAVVSHLNITDRKALETALRHDAETDRLTGLANRSMLESRLASMIREVQQDACRQFAVMFLDFDRFKVINDSLGHDVGDQLLCEIARRLRSFVEMVSATPNDASGHLIARFGGDEFVILLDNVGDESRISAMAHRLHELLGRSYRLGDVDIHTTASIGVVSSAVCATSPADVIRDADTAMYEAKQRGKAQTAIFDVTMRQRVQERMTFENDLRNALDSDQLFVMYQPIVCLRTGTVESVEALVRWRHPQRGLIPPATFIPIAEDIGLIVDIDEWVLQQACQQFVAWQRAMGSRAPRSISVNLSRVQLLLPRTPQVIRRTLADCGMDPKCLQLEVTESTVMNDAHAATEILNELKAIGVTIAVDDFGTGYSSLACLNQFPFDVLKIDRGFIRRLTEGRCFAALVQAVVEMSRNLDIRVVCEGIETQDQALVLQSLDCDFGQGYLFSRPMMPQDLPGFMVPRVLASMLREPA